MNKKNCLMFFLMFAASFYSFSGVTVITQCGQGTLEDYYQSGKVSSFENGKLISVFDFSNATVTIVEQTQGMYATTSMSEYQSLLKKYIDSAKDQMTEMMKSNPQMAAYLEQARKSQAGKKIHVVKGKQKQVSEFTFDQYLLKRGDSIETIYWVSDKIGHLVGQEIDLKKMKAFMADTEQSVSGMDFVNSEDYYNAVKSIHDKGFVVYEQGIDESAELKSVTEGSIDAGKFKVPSGLNKVSAEEILAFQMSQDESEEDEY